MSTEKRLFFICVKIPDKEGVRWDFQKNENELKIVEPESCMEIGRQFILGSSTTAPDVPQLGVVLQ